MGQPANTKKCTKREKERRLLVILGKIRDRWPRYRTLKFIKSEWGVQIRQARNYYRQAEQVWIEEECANDREEYEKKQVRRAAYRANLHKIRKRYMQVVNRPPKKTVSTTRTKLKPGSKTGSVEDIAVIEKEVRTEKMQVPAWAIEGWLRVEKEIATIDGLYDKGVLEQESERFDVLEIGLGDEGQAVTDERSGGDKDQRQPPTS